MRGVYIGNQRILVSPVWGGKLIVSGQDLSLSPDLIIHGVYEIPLTRYLLNNIKQGNTVFDIGANLGYFTVIMGALVGRQGKVIAYEANPDNCELLRDNVAMNYLIPQTKILNKAVYSTTAELSLYKTTRFHGNSSLTRHSSNYFDFFGEEHIDTITVEAEPLDIYMNKIDHIDFIKIDIEGGEYDAILGMQGLIRQKIVGTVIFELNKMMLGDQWDEFHSLLENFAELHGAKFYTLTLEGELSQQRLETLFAEEQIPSVVMKFHE